MFGSRIAAIIRGVMASEGMRSLECTLATTTSSCARSAGSWSSAPSSRMSTSIPVRMRNGASRSLSTRTTSSCCRSRSALSPCAMVSRGEWSVSTMYSWPSARAVTAISSIGLPPSDQSECVWQSPRSCHPKRLSAGVDRAVVDCFELAQVFRDVACVRLRDHLRGDRADAGNAAERPTCDVPGHLRAPELSHPRRGGAERAHAVGRFAVPLEDVRDAVERRFR